MKPKTVVIGAGISGLAAACHLAQAGHHVTVVEKNDGPGGRMRTFTEKGFTFDMGPSWYWMPEIFETFFAEFGKKPSDYYTLVNLDPQYRMYFSDDFVDLPSNPQETLSLFESIEPGSGEVLQKYLKHSQWTYRKAIDDYMMRVSDSPFEFLNFEFLSGVLKAGILQSYGKMTQKNFKNHKLQEIIDFAVLFLGEKPKKIPYLYSLFIYTKLVLGTWYPMGGMFEITKAVYTLAQELGVEFEFNSEVTHFSIEHNAITQVHTFSKTFPCDSVIASGDYHHIEQNLLPKQYRRYSEKYWDSRTMCPSSLLFYLGVDTKVPELTHHTLFFDTDFDTHAQEIYDTPTWPTKPLFYVCTPSKTDPSVAPKGKENMFILVPLAPGLHDSDELREKYYNVVMERIEKKVGISIRDKVVYKRSFAMDDFTKEYNSYKGNAYGLANNLTQTAILKPKMKSKIPNMVYAGQLTVPGPGIPPSFYSGKMAAQLISDLKV